MFIVSNVSLAPCSPPLDWGEDIYELISNSSFLGPRLSPFQIGTSLRAGHLHLLVDAPVLCIHSGRLGQ